MRFALFSLIVALLAAVAMAVPPEYISVIVSWPNGAPESIVQSAIKTVEKDGGKVTHKYNIFPGFAADIPKNNVPKIEALSTEYPALVESDGIVTTQGDKKDESGIHF